MFFKFYKKDLARTDETTKRYEFNRGDAFLVNKSHVVEIYFTTSSQKTYDMNQKLTYYSYDCIVVQMIDGKYLEFYGEKPEDILNIETIY